MAEHLHDDRFDEFLKNSLDNYSESPPDSVWEAIEEGVPVPGIPAWRRYWWVGLAVVILMGALVFQHFYYALKLDKLEMKLQAKTEQAVASAESIPSSANSETAMENDAEQSIQETEIPQKIYPEKSIIQHHESGLTSRAEDGGQKEGLSSGAIPPAKDSENNEQMIASSHDQLIAQNQNSAMDSKDKREAIIASGQLAAIAPLQILLVGEEPFRTDLDLNLPLQVASAKQLWAGPSFSLYSANREFTGTTGSHHHGGGPHPHFEQQSAASGLVTSSGLVIEKEMLNGLQLQTGLLYTVSSFSSTHSPAFKLSESMPGMHGFDHDFQYSLYTPSGSATLTLRVEQVDTTVQVSPDESIGLSVGTNQKFRYVSVPLGIAWRTHRGRFGLGLSTGLIGNFLLDSGMRVSNIEVQNPLFQVRHEGNTSLASMETTAPFFLEMEAAASFSVLLRPGLLLQIGPAMRFQLSNSSADAQSGSKGFAAGLTTAFLYRF